MNNTPLRLTPSSFDPDDTALTALGRPADWRWPSLADTLAPIGGKAATYMLPLFWQMEPPVFVACRAAGVPLFTVQPDNIAVAAASIRYAESSAIIAEARSAEPLHEHLIMYQDPLPELWFVIHSAATDNWHDTPPRLSGRVCQEVHLYPGLPVLWQCLHLSQTGAQRFHRSEEYTWDETGARISSLDGSLPVRDSSLPFTLQSEGSCTCGRDIVSAYA